MNNSKHTPGSAQQGFLLILFCTAALRLISCTHMQPPDNWENVRKITSQITVPVFPDRNYVVTDFGGVGDGVTDCHGAFKSAIDKCNQEGGGRIVVPAGVFLVKGPIHLKSNVHMYLSDSCRLEFSTDPADYLPMVLTRWEGTELFNYSPFIYAYQATNVAITGKGIIDGNAELSFAPWKPHQKADQSALREMGNDGVPVYNRVFGEGHFLRPGTVQFFGCKNVLVDGVRIVDAPFWVIHPTLCTNVTVRNLVVDSWNPNNDGVDPDGCVNVLIEDCVFNCGDDAIAIKSGRDQDGWRIGQPTENVVIRNCIMNSRANGLCIGSEMSGSVRNVYMEDCEVGEAHSTIYFKGNPDRGGIVENIFVRNITVERAKTAFIRFESNYKGHRGNNYPPRFRNFVIEKVTCNQADHYGIYAVGIEHVPISDIIIRDMRVTNAEIPVFALFVENMKLSNVMINDSLFTEIPAPGDLTDSKGLITW